MVSDFAAKAPFADAQELATAISSASGLYAHFKADTSIEGQSRASNVEELLNSILQFKEERQQEYLEDLQADGRYVEGEDVQYPLVTLGEFLENVSLLANVDIEDGDDTNNKIALMTAHSAKGLEFPYVFVAGLEENLFPSGGMLASKTDVEEERRLFYVAMTRAKKAVWLSYSSSRMRNGKHESNSPSRFIKEIDPRYLANPLMDDFGSSDDDDDDFDFRRPFRGFGSRMGTSKPATRFGMSTGGVQYFPGQRQKVERQPAVPTSSVSREALRNRPLPPKIPDADFTPVAMTELKVGHRIEHNRFGFGKVLDISGSVPDLKAKIVFDDYGEKILLLKYAKIRLA